MTIPVKALVSAALAVNMQGQALLQNLGVIPTQVAGQTVAQYVESIGLQSSETVLSNGAKVIIDTASTALNNPVVSSGSSASSAFAAYGGDIAITGAASQAATQVAPVTVIKSGIAGAVAKVGGVLSMSLPAASAALAPLLGVTLGEQLYKSNPDFWTKVSQKLLPFCYPDSDVMPMYADENGQAYVDKDVVDALKELFDEEGIGGESSIGTSSWDGKNFYFTANRIAIRHYTAYRYYIYEYEIRDGIGYFFRLDDTLFVVSRVNRVYTRNYLEGSTPSSWSSQTISTHATTLADGTVAYGWGFGDFIELTTMMPNSDSGYTVDSGNAAFVTGVDFPAGYPDGTSEWGGTSIDYTQLPESYRYTDIANEETTKIIPVSLPTDPTKSNDPTLNPDPAGISNPDTITKYISPDTTQQQPTDYKPTIGEQEAEKTAPFEYPIPKYDPIPSPNPNPSQPVTPLPPSGLISPLPFPSMGTNHSSPVPNPDAIFSGTAGLITVYNPDSTALIQFAHWLWVTYADATIDKIWNNPFDGIISLHELYATPSTGATISIRSGFLDSGVPAPSVPVRYTEINCGSVVISEFYANYLDYSPYSKAHVYLPFIGIVEVNVDDIVGHGVNITYRVDAYSGACIALITCAREGYSNTIYQFGGNCSVEMPIAGGSQASIKAGQMIASAQQHAAQVSGTAGLVGGLASMLGGRIASGLASAITSPVVSQAQGEAAAVQATVTAKSSVQHSGSFGESFGAMGNKKPYLIIHRPVQVVVPNYNDEYGFPAHKLVRIGDCEGFIRCREVHVISATATDNEKQMIQQLLKTGVIV